MRLLAFICAATCFSFAGVAAHAAAAPPGAPRNDYANAAFSARLNAGLQHFYARDFKHAQDDFSRALSLIGDNTLALSFLNASAAQQPGALDSLVNEEEDAVTGAPKNYVNHVRLGFSYLFQSDEGRDRTQDARDELNAAVALDGDKPAAHVGLGIMRFNERSANRAKSEFLAALHNDPNNVLAREYLGQLYQADLRDPQRGLAYLIDVPNLVPQYADILFHIGSLLNDLQQPDAALKYLQEGLALDTGHVGEAGQHGYLLMGQIYIAQHKLADAKRVLQLAIDDDTDPIIAKTLLDRITSGAYDQKDTSPKS
jgi:tetratricopeptide (TPR) repeat protein